MLAGAKDCEELKILPFTGGLPERRIAAHFGVMAALLASCAAPALATPPPVSGNAGGGTSTTGAGTGSDVSDSGGGQAMPSNKGGFFSGLGRRSNLLGDIGGLRSKLSKYGVSLSILETSELLGNISGGKRKGADYDGLTQVDLQMDTQRAFNHYGGTFNVSALQIHGTNLSADNLLTLQTSSGIEADRATRLWELWYDQKFLDEDKLDIKVGQQSLDQEFIVSQNALLFVNTMFGWPLIPSVDLPAGGPAYPLSEIGVRARYVANPATNLLLGVYGGSPSPNNYQDSQRADNNGLKFPTNNGVLAFAEAQFLYPALGNLVYPGQSAPLPHVFKIGGWYDSEKFNDETTGTDGLSLANPNSNGIPRQHRGDYSVYATYDQMIGQSHTEYDRTYNVFARVMTAPQADRNLADFSANLGYVVTDPFHNRDDDSAGIALGVAHVGEGAADLDSATALYGGGYVPRRTTETFVEATYQYQVTPWFNIQPDAQYIINPGGGVANPDQPNSRVGNEMVLGTRFNIVF